MADLTLDLRYLRFALAAAEQGSFRRAAATLGVPQSSISRRVQALEDRLGVALFERHPAGVKVTTAGERFFEEAAPGLDQLSRAVQTAAKAREVKRGELCIGIFASLSSGFLRTLLRQFAARHRDVKIRLQLGTPEDHFASLIAGRIDVAFLTGEPAVTGCQTLPLWMEHVLLALPEGHPLASRDEIAWGDIRHERFIVSATGPGPEIANYLIKRLGGLSFRPDIEHHDVGRDDLMHMVAIGFGLTLTSASTLGTAFPDVLFRPIAGNRDLLPWCAIWSSSNTNPALKSLLAVAASLSDRAVCSLA